MNQTVRKKVLTVQIHPIRPHKLGTGIFTSGDCHRAVSLFFHDQIIAGGIFLIAYGEAKLAVFVGGVDAAGVEAFCVNAPNLHLIAMLGLQADLCGDDLLSGYCVDQTAAVSSHMRRGGDILRGDGVPCEAGDHLGRHFAPCGPGKPSVGCLRRTYRQYTPLSA